MTYKWGPTEVQKFYGGYCISTYQLVKKELCIKAGRYKEKENNHIQREEEEAVNFEWRGKRDPGGAERDKQTGKRDTVIDGKRG